MSHIFRFRNAWRLAGLVLFIAAALGPWLYSTDGAPRPEACVTPFVLLENGRCYRLESGLAIYSSFIHVIQAVISGMVKGQSAFLGPGSPFAAVMLTAVILALFIPLAAFLTTLRQVFRAYRRRWQVFHMIAWAAAFLAAIPILINQSRTRALGGLWGMGLYISLAASSLLWETLVLAAARSPASRTPLAEGSPPA